MWRAFIDDLEAVRANDPAAHGTLEILRCHTQIGANAFVRMHDVPANCTAAGTPARIVKRDGVVIDEEPPRTRLSDRSIPVSISNERPAPASEGPEARSGS